LNLIESHQANLEEEFEPHKPPNKYNRGTAIV